MDKAKARHAWQAHKTDAKQRGIPFYFKFESWVAWWEKELGPNWQNLRGCRRGQYVMARLADKGPYHPRNVRCVLAEINQLEYNMLRKPQTRNQRPKLSKNTVVEIFKSSLTHSELAAIHNVAKYQVAYIKRRKYYRTYTDELI